MDIEQQLQSTEPAIVHGVAAIIKGTVPGASNIDTEGVLAVYEQTGGEVITFGRLAGETTPDGSGFHKGALLVTQEGRALLRPDDTPYVVDVHNPAETPFYGRGEGIAVHGDLDIRYDAALRIETFLLPNFDVLASRPGFVLGDANDPDNTAQGISHKGGTRVEEVGRDECAP